MPRNRSPPPYPYLNVEVAGHPVHQQVAHQHAARVVGVPIRRVGFAGLYKWWVGWWVDYLIREGESQKLLERRKREFAGVHRWNEECQCFSSSIYDAFKTSLYSSFERKVAAYFRPLLVLRLELQLPFGKLHEGIGGAVAPVIGSIHRLAELTTQADNKDRKSRQCERELGTQESVRLRALIKRQKGVTPRRESAGSC